MVAALDDIAGVVSLTALVVATLALLVALAAIARRRAPAPAPPPEPARPVEPLTVDAALDAWLVSQAERLEELSVTVGGLRGSASAADRRVRHALQHVGLVRFNPFDDTGGNQSFALALLDANGDGFVLSSLHARGATRLYVKAILGGHSEATLSAEEAAALLDAGLEV